MTSSRLTLRVLPGTTAICRLDPRERIPDWCLDSPFFSITRAVHELSIVCSSSAVPSGCRAEHGWRIFAVQGPLDFSLTGILASLAAPLAEAGIAIFAISTFDTDYLLVREDDLTGAIGVLEGAGHAVAE